MTRGVRIVAGQVRALGTQWGDDSAVRQRQSNNSERSQGQTKEAERSGFVGSCCLRLTLLMGT
jgi:hypothetical protein